MQMRLTKKTTKNQTAQYQDTDTYTLIQFLNRVTIKHTYILMSLKPRQKNGKKKKKQKK